MQLAALLSFCPVLSAVKYSVVVLSFIEHTCLLSVVSGSFILKNFLVMLYFYFSFFKRKCWGRLLEQRRSIPNICFRTEKIWGRQNKT